MKVLIVSEGWPNSAYSRPFQEFGESTGDSDLLWKKPKDIALVVFTGGADVSPALYGEEAGHNTSYVPRRDIYESIVFHQAKRLNKPMAGICRGAQFLNVMAGGKLCQHLDNHGNYHDMQTIDGRCFEVSSTHHQMMLPPIGSQVIGWAARKRSYRYLGAKSKPMWPEPDHEYEVIYWPYIRAVGMQFHPEIMGENTEGFLFAAELVKRHLLRKK